MSGRIDEFRDKGCEVLGISTDSVETHERWLTTDPSQGGIGALQFPLASDDDGDVCRRYDVYVGKQHLALRAMFIIDPNGVLQYQSVHSLSVGRSVEETLRVLDALQSGGLCPAERETGQDTIDVEATLGPNRVIGQYRIESEIGRGAFGTVFLARDQTLERNVALKVLRNSDAASSQQLLDEARAAAAFNHPNVCTIHNVDNSNGATMIVMEYVDGNTLSEILSDGPIEIATAMLLIRQIASGVAAAHDAGVVHGDLKPGNLMVTPNETLRIMDFGLARRVSPADTLSETIISDSSLSGGLSGTPGYMAPEQTRGESVSLASDVFALGLIVCEILTGRPVISGKNLLEVLRKIERFEVPADADSFPEPLKTIVREALKIEPSGRPAMRKLVSLLG